MHKNSFKPYNSSYIPLLGKSSFFVFCLIVVLSAVSKPANADSMTKSSPFAEGSYRATLIFGRGTGFNNTYAIYGLGVAYYIRDGLEVGMDIEDWTGASPHITRISPEIRYVFYATPFISPYVGLFYRHAYVSGQDGIDSFGIRAGVNFTLSENIYIGIGMAYESALNCSGDCRTKNPELLVAFTF